MIARVITDLETIVVELGDLLPCHVIAFVRGEVEALGDEERRSEAVLLQERTGDGEV